jgi:endonuclease YncB( thermonuclease family)
MRHLALCVLTVLVALGLVYAFVAPFTGGLDTPAISGQGVDVTPENFELPDEMKNDVPGDGSEAAEPQERVTSPEARQVDPDVPLFPGNQSAPLERIEPRQPLSEMGQAAPPAPPPTAVPVDNTAKPALLYRPVATAAGTIEVSGYKIALEGIDALPPDETCNSDGGGTWPCGMAARTAFRNWLRSRAVECTVPAQPSDDLIATQCRLGNEDIAGWLVQNGWARAKDGSPMAETMKKAEEAKLGIFGDPPPALPASIQLPLPSFSDTPLPPAEPVPAPPPLLAPDAPFPPRPQ